MKINVVLATFNRAAILEQVLTSYLKLESPRDGWRLLLADNGSTDRTPQVAEAFSAQLPIKYIREDRPGKTMAVNAALDEADAELILFTDDDVLPNPKWLVQYERAAENNPEFDIFGGPLTLKWPSPPKPWMISNHAIEGDCFAATNPANVSGPHNSIVVGGNFAVRSRAVYGGTRFDPNMGPKGKGESFPQGNEAEFLQRLMRQGYKAWWIGEATVEHIVRPEQMSKDWMWGRAVRAGRGHFRMDVGREGLPPMFFGVPRFVLRDLAVRGIRWVQAFVTGDEVQQFEARYFLNYTWGKLLEGRRMNQQMSSPKSAANA